MNTLEFNLVQFIHVLRQLDIKMSSAEVIDAAKAISEVDILCKREVKTALQSTLIKTSRDRRIFDRAFELFFVTPEEKQHRLDQRYKQQAQKAEQLQEAQEELTYTENQWQDELGSMSLEEVKLEFTEEQLETYTRLPEHAKEQIKKILEQASGNPVNSPQELIQRTIQGALNYWKYHLLKQEEQLGLRTQLDVELTGNPELDLVIEGVSQSFQGYDEEIQYQDMKNIADKDIERAGRIIRQLTRLLATRISRRYRKSLKRRNVDMRRTIRKNIGYGGVPLEIKYMAGRVQKPELLLLCDVSESMARYGSFILQFIYGLTSAVDQIESFVFSENLKRVTPTFEKERSFAVTMTDILNESSKLGRGTDLNQALVELNNTYKSLLTSKTILIIVSDTKTLAPDKAAKQLTYMKNQVKDIVWLNTLPKRDWKTSKAVDQFRKDCLMFECFTLNHLENVMRKKVF